MAVAVTEGRLPPPCELDLRAFSFFWVCFFASGFFLWSTCFFSCGLSSLRAALGFRASCLCLEQGKVGVLYAENIYSFIVLAGLLLLALCACKLPNSIKKKP